MKLSWKFIVPSLILAPLLLMPFWLILTEPYIVKPSPLKLYEAIHPTYYIGLLALILSIAILPVKTWRASRPPLNPYLVTAILATLYMQLPPIALFEHPVSDHTTHLMPAFYMLREGNIHMPNYPHPETVTPQLLASILIMITSLPSPLEDLHRISLLVLPLLTTLYVYIFMRRLGAGERFAMMASVLNMGLMHVSFMFLRQTYAMPLYIMLVFLVFMSMKERQANYSVLAIVTTLAFIMSDPAHVLLTIIPLTLFAAMWKGLDLLRKVNYKSFRAPWIFILFMGVTFSSWIINRYPGLFPDLWRIAETLWDVFIRSISELTLPTQESSAYWGRPTALAYNDYYVILYRIRVTLVTLSIILPIALFVSTFLNRKTRPIIFKYETVYLTIFFVSTAIVLVTRGYGFTYTPWTAITTFYVLHRLILKAKKRSLNYLILRYIFSFYIAFLLTSLIISPHVINSGGKVRLETKDIYSLSWLSVHSQGISLICPGSGSWLGEVAYINWNGNITTFTYLFYEGFTTESIRRLVNYDKIIIPNSALMFFERTEDVHLALKKLGRLADKLNDSHNLIYNSGIPFTTIWLRA